MNIKSRSGEDAKTTQIYLGHLRPASGVTFRGSHLPSEDTTPPLRVALHLFFTSAAEKGVFMCYEYQAKRIPKDRLGFESWFFGLLISIG
jgi:hypothetical protein